jgi:putative membrane protein
MISWDSLGSFLIYFGAALLAEAIFVALYMAITPHHEAKLIKDGNVAASISLAGAVIGFTLPLVSVVIGSVSLLDMVIWSAVALVVQIAVFVLVSLVLRGLSRRIEAGNIAAGVTVAAASLAIGAVNAASMSY